MKKWMQARIEQAKRAKNKLLTGAGLAVVGPAAMAASQFDPITSAVSWTTVGAAIIAIAALKAAPLVVSVGSKLVLRMIGR